MTYKTTTFRMDEQDREAMRTIRAYYGVDSDTYAVRIALRETVRAIEKQQRETRQLVAAATK